MFQIIQALQQQPEKANRFAPGMAYDPEIVFYVDYLADEAGWAHTLQVHPDGGADYVRHRPAQLFRFDQKRYEQLRKKGFNFEI